MKNFLKIGLLVIVIICTSFIFYCSGLETRSYNESQAYNADITGKGYIEQTRPVLITENANINGCIVALGILAGASLIGIAVISSKEAD